jgi:hypothetical protein
MSYMLVAISVSSVMPGPGVFDTEDAMYPVKDAVPDFRPGSLTFQPFWQLELISMVSVSKEMLPSEIQISKATGVTTPAADVCSNQIVIAVLRPRAYLSIGVGLGVTAIGASCVGY